MIVKLLTEYHLEFLSLNGGCTGSSESTLFKMPLQNHMSRLICVSPITYSACMRNVNCALSREIT